MKLMGSRYDGWADWYDGWNAPHAARNADEVLALLGRGAGLCLDLGCGTGLYFDILSSSGRTVVGLDRSADQLRIARRRRSRQILQGDGAALPFGDGVFPTVAALWISTDVDDFATVLAEASGSSRPAGCSCSTAPIPASTGHTCSGWTMAACSLTRRIVRPAGIWNRHGGATTSAADSGCATTLLLTFSTRSSVLAS